MQKNLKCYINGEWLTAEGKESFTLINPATEDITTTYTLSNAQDVDKAVKAARKAFETYSQTSREERIALLENIVFNLEKRQSELAEAITLELGAPTWLASKAQAVLPIAHAKVALEVLRTYPFETELGISLIKETPIGVCGLITPWNWPAALIISKMLPALATGCTVVLKPSEYSPFSAAILAEVMHDSGVPAGVFNMVYGDGQTVGAAISAHPDIDCVSFTGSTRAGIDVAKSAAPTVKRVVQELGGKSPNIILPSSDLAKAVKDGIKGLMMNSGQSCSAPSRMLVPKARLAEVKTAVIETMEKVLPGSPDSGAYVGPVVNEKQYKSIQAYIQSGIDEGASVLVGGLGKPDGLEKGYYVKPTVFIDTTPDMKIVKEEIFGPVLVIQAYDHVEEAVALALDTTYGLAAYIQGQNLEEIRAIAERIPAGQIYCNGSGNLNDFSAPFGGFKRSGNGREWGSYAFADFLEHKALVGYLLPEKK